MIVTANTQTTEMSTVDALWVLIQSQSKRVRQMLAKRILAEQGKAQAQQQMVEESLTRAFNELHAGKVHHNARNLFK